MERVVRVRVDIKDRIVDSRSVLVDVGLLDAVKHHLGVPVVLGLVVIGVIQTFELVHATLKSGPTCAGAS